MGQLVGADLPQDQAALHQKGVGLGRGAALVLREMDQHEVRRARRHVQAELGDLFREPRQPFGVVFARALLMRGVLDRGNAGRDRRPVDIERSADAVDSVDHMRRAVHPAEAKRREPVNLRERARHHHVLAGGDELNAGFVVVVADVFGIGRVDHEQHMRRQAAVQPLDLVERQVGAGRIVRVGEEDHLGLRRHPLENLVDVGGEVLFRRDHGRGAGAERGNRIDQEAVRGVDRLVAVGEIGPRQQIEQIVGACATHDARRIEPKHTADRVAQLRRRAVRVILEVLADGVVGSDRLRARAERRLVGRQLENLVDARRAALAGYVGVDFKHALAWLRTGSSHRNRSWIPGLAYGFSGTV